MTPVWARRSMANDRGHVLCCPPWPVCDGGGDTSRSWRRGRKKKTKRGVVQLLLVCRGRCKWGPPLLLRSDRYKLPTGNADLTRPSRARSKNHRPSCCRKQRVDAENPPFASQVDLKTNFVPNDEAMAHSPATTAISCALTQVRY